VSVGTPRTRLEAAATAGAVDGSLQVIGVGWATVDLERAAGEIGPAVGIGPNGFADAPDSVALGARCLVAPGVLGPGRIAVVILEPSTEGRLAGHLARHDEGPAVVWLAGSGPDSNGDAAGRTPGPFGPEAIQHSVPGRPDLLRCLVDRAPGTIRS